MFRYNTAPDYEGEERRCRTLEDRAWTLGYKQGVRVESDKHTKIVEATNDVYFPQGKLSSSYIRVACCDLHRHMVLMDEVTSRNLIPRLGVVEFEAVPVVRSYDGASVGWYEWRPRR